MSATTFVFAKDVKTERFSAVAGMPVPSKFGKAHLNWFRKTFGADVVRPLDYTKPEDFLAIVVEDPKRLIKLQQLCDSQAKTIKQLKAENEKLLADRRS